MGGVGGSDRISQVRVGEGKADEVRNGAQSTLLVTSCSPVLPGNIQEILGEARKDSELVS